MQAKLILASQSAGRKKIMREAGLDFDSIAANLNEDEMMLDWQALGHDATFVAKNLAVRKAQKISLLHQDALVVGCDQMLVCEGRWFGRPHTIAEAKENLQFLRGREHVLTSAVAVVRDSKTLWHYVDTAQIKMRNFSDDFLESYIAKMGDAILSSVGCYQVEGMGMQLLDAIKGDHYTIIGLPILPLLHFLRTEQAIAS